MEQGIQYKSVIDICKRVFEEKYKDYGSSWRILSLTALTDQIFIKAHRVKILLCKQKQYVDDPISEDIIGVINYAFIALIQIKMQIEDNNKMDLTLSESIKLYDDVSSVVYKLYLNKNHDYGGAWKTMRLSSIVDMILTKIRRLVIIEKHNGTVVVSEGVDAIYRDIVNYGVFAFIKDKDKSMRECKLVRDNVPDILSSKEHQVVVEPIRNNNEFILHLKCKLMEETQELIDSLDGNDINAIKEGSCDVLEVIETMLDMYHVQLSDVQEYKEQKATTRGKFNKKLLITIDPNATITHTSS